MNFEDLATETIRLNKSREQVFYHFVNCELQGTFDNRVMIKVERRDWVTDCREDEKRSGDEIIRTEKKVPILQESEPYLVVELSLHKFILGQNVFGGSNDIIGQFRKFLEVVNFEFASSLTVDDFTVMRIDYAEAYKFSSFDKVQKYISIIKKAKYPRRNKPLHYGNESIYYTGTTSTLKFYHKGPEFKRHDRKRLNEVVGKDLTSRIEEYANKVLRIEVEVKRKTLMNMFGFYPSLYELNEKFGLIICFWESEVNKVIELVNDRNKKFECAADLRNYMKSELGSRLANSVYLTFLNLQIMGVDETRKVTSKPTWYRHKRLLKELGIDWKKTSFEIVEQKRLDSEILEFRPVRNSVNCVDSSVIDLFMNTSIAMSKRFFMECQLARLA